MSGIIMADARLGPEEGGRASSLLAIYFPDLV